MSAAKKRGPGRPPGSGAGLSDRLQLKVSPSMRSAVQADAERRGEVEAEWWRRAATERLARERRGGVLYRPPA
jgi:hypothetical protein